MTKSQEIQLAQSKNRTAINELLKLETRSDEQTTELETMTKRAETLEIEFRAALAAEVDPIETPNTQTHPCLLYTSPSPRDS